MLKNNKTIANVIEKKLAECYTFKNQQVPKQKIIISYLKNL